MSESLQRLPGSPGCFICDNNDSNPRALKLKLLWNEADQTVEIPFSPDQSWCGYAEVVHGGLVAAVLDEAMAWLVKQSTGAWAFTADFHLRYKKPLNPGCAYKAVARLEKNEGRKINVSALVQDEEGRTLASAQAIFLPAGGLARPRGEGS